MLAPEELIGQRVWVEIPRDLDLPGLDPHRLKAVITQPTSPPWFYARFEDPPPTISSLGKWLTLLEAQQAYLLHPVYEEEFNLPLEDYSFEDEFELS
jgi:hypothetical protein